MGWKDSMRDASFKGVPFFVDTAEKEGGRNTVVHEFIQRDAPYVEDMGQATSTFPVNAFLFGDDYFSKRDALERVLEEGGPGTLIHPYYGEITVDQAAKYRVRYSRFEGGYCVITMTFVRVEAASGPAPAVDAEIVAFSAAQTAGNAACDAFDAVFAIVGQPAFVVESGFSAVQDAVTAIQGALSVDVADVLADLGITSGYDLAGLASPGRAIWGVVRQIAAVSGKNGASLGTGMLSSVPSQIAPAALPESAGSMRTTIAANTDAVTMLSAELAVVEAAKAYTVAEPESHAQARDMRYAFVDSLDAVLEAETAPAASYVPFTDLRAQTLFAMAEKAKDAPEIVTVTEIIARPSLVIVHAVTGGIATEADFLRRNGVIHPGFVPPGEQEVLRDA